MIAQNTVRTNGIIRYFDLLKAFGYIKRVVKSDFLVGKDLFYFMCVQTFDLLTAFDYNCIHSELSTFKFTSVHF